jgi:hypothetical protein
MIVAAPLANLVIRRLGGNADRQEVGGRLNNRAEDSHQAFRLRIPRQSGRGFRFDVGHRSDLIPATIPK